MTAGDERGSDVAFAGLQRLEGYLRSQVGKAMQLRFVPELRFIRDEGAERGGRVLSLLSGLRSAGGVQPGGFVSDGESSGSDVELMTFDSDEDIIVVDDKRA